MLKRGGTTFPMVNQGVDDRLADERKGATTSPSTSTGPEAGAQGTTADLGSTASTSEKTT